MLNQLFEGYLFSFGGTPVFVVFSVVIVVVLIFFGQNQRRSKQKLLGTKS